MRIHSKQFHAALKRLKPAVSDKPTLPVLSCFKIEGDTVMATNQDITITTRIECEEPPAKSFVLPFQETLNILQNLNDFVDVAPEVIKCGKTKYNMGTPSDVALWPNNPVIDQKNECFIGAEVIVALKKAATLCSEEKRLYGMANVCISLSGEMLKIMSTDSMIGFVQAFDQKNAGEDFKISCPPAIINALQESDYTMRVSENKIVFENPSYSIVGPLAEEKFPNLEKIIDMEMSISIPFVLSSLNSALSLITPFKVLPICKFEFSDSKVELTVTDYETNKEAFTEIEMPSGVPLELIKYNVNSMKSVLKLIPEETPDIEINCIDRFQPTIITSKHNSVKLLIAPYGL